MAGKAQSNQKGGRGIMCSSMKTRAPFDGIDEAILATVNASLKHSVTIDDLLSWLGNGIRKLEAKALSPVEIFFVEVPIGFQVRFLMKHGIREESAVAVARSLGLRSDIPLARKLTW